MTLLPLTFCLALAAVVPFAIRYICQCALHNLAVWVFLKNYFGNSNAGTPTSGSKASPGIGTNKGPYPRLSRPSSCLKPSYDVVVIGSGYGSGVAASRFARAGKDVCVLERGAEKWPGEYPHTAKGAMGEYEVSGQLCGKSFRAGKEAGLYQTVKGQGQDVFMGCGLGGTSLINAGVWLQADDRVLRGKDWPAEIKRDGLDEYYDRGKQMFNPTPYPSTHQTPLKLSALGIESHNLGLQDTFYRPPITTSFHSGPNQAGVYMQASTGSGNECTGTNDGSKSSVLVTYLADAWARGAELFCGIDVRYLKKRPKSSGYVVFFDVVEANGRKRSSWVVAQELVILGAGAIGTPLILLRSRLYGLTTSPLLGQRLSGNGDALHFAYNCNRELNSMGHEPTKNCGPTITGCIDLRGAAHTSRSADDGLVIQDGAIPQALSPIIQSLLETHRYGTYQRWYNNLRGMVARIKSWILGPYTKNGSVQRTLVFLTMSHDEGQGTLNLENDQAFVRWVGPSEAGDRTSRVVTILKTITEHLGGIFIKSPAMTVHPLGGAVMSDDGTGLGGVVSHRGELFATPGSTVHEGVFCMDGSAIPTSLGVNPCATITALAERACDLIIREREWQSDSGLNGELDLFGDPPFAQVAQPSSDHHQDIACPQLEGVRFDEIMEGHMNIGSNITDFQAAEKIAKSASSIARLTLRVTARQEDADSYHGSANGTFSCGALSPDPLLVTDSFISFFTIDEGVADAKRLIYSLEVMSTEGKKYTVHGYKHVDPSITLSILRTWRATTTLYTTITDSTGFVVGRGVLHLRSHAFVSELRSLYSMNKGLPCLKFLSFFARNIAWYFFAPFRPLQQSTPSKCTSGYYTKRGAEDLSLTADDGMVVPLKIWHPQSSTVLRRTPLILIPGASVDEQIFSLPTIPINTIDHFTSLGYTCYVPLLRFGAGENARYGHTAFDARLDVSAVLKYVYEQEGRKAYVVAHCLGSIATAMALLTGEAESSWIAGMTVSQVFMHIECSPDNALKAQRPWLIEVYKAISGSSWFPLSSHPRIGFLDSLLRFYPTGSRGEVCRSAVCHRCDVPFGRCWTHANLNHATHLYLNRFFDGIHTHFLKHLSGMGAVFPFHVRTNFPSFDDLVTSENLRRLKDIRIAFLYGQNNAVWSSRATEKSFHTLREVYPETAYERILIDGYGHLDCWMGPTAYNDIWPRVARHIRLCEETIIEEFCFV